MLISGCGIQTGGEWKEVAMEHEGVAVKCPSAYISSNSVAGETLPKIFCRDSGAEYMFTAEEWDKDPDPDKNREGAFRADSTVVGAFGDNLISANTVKQGDMIAQEMVYLSKGLPIIPEAKETSKPADLTVERSFFVGTRLYHMRIDYRLSDPGAYQKVLEDNRKNSEKYFGSFRVLRENS